MLEVAVSEDRIGRNPAHGVRVAPAPRREARFLTEAEVRSIADEVPDRYRALVWTLALSGLRIGEAAALRVKHIEGDTIRVVESSAEVRGRKVTGPTKSGKGRTVDIPPELRKMLHDHLTTYSNRFDPEALVFPGSEGGQLRQNAFRKRVFQPAAERAGIEPTPTVHDLRHTAACSSAGRVHAARGGGPARPRRHDDDRALLARLPGRAAGEGGTAWGTDRSDVEHAVSKA